MAAAKKKTKKPAPKKKAVVAKKKPAPAKKKPVLHLLPVPDSKQAALSWFANLASRIQDAGVQEIQALIAEARTYDLVGLEDVLGDHEQVLELNRAANELINAGIDAFGAASPQGFQLQVLRDILNDS